jgi:hypothetical protein
MNFSEVQLGYSLEGSLEYIIWENFTAELATDLLEKCLRGPLGKALVTGITGQDGSYLAELLFEKE